ncbi:MAG: hypothetical protein ACUVTQ_10660 [Desulfotomaculales bacterium]
MAKRILEVRYDPAEGVTILLPCFRALPQESLGHMRSARRELLLALRALIDAAVARLEESQTPRPRRVEVAGGEDAAEG